MTVLCFVVARINIKMLSICGSKQWGLDLMYLFISVLFTASKIRANNGMISHEQCAECEVDFTSSYDGLGRRCSHVSLLFSIHSAAT